MFQIFGYVEMNNLINPWTHSTNEQKLLGCKSYGVSNKLKNLVRLTSSIGYVGEYQTRDHL